MEQYESTDSLEIVVKDSEGQLKEIRFVKKTKTGSKEFIPNILFYKILKTLGSKPPMVFPLGRWKTYKEI